MAATDRTVRTLPRGQEMQLLHIEGDKALMRPTTGNEQGLEFWINRQYLKTGEGVNPQWLENTVANFMTHNDVDMTPYHCSAALQDALRIGGGHGDADEWKRALVNAGYGIAKPDREPGTLVWYPTGRPEGHIGIMAYDSSGNLRMISQKSGRITWEDPPDSAIYMRNPYFG